MPDTYIYGTVSPQAKVTIGTTRGQLSTVSAREVWIRSDSSNTGRVYLGDVTVTSAGGGNVFTYLDPGDGIVLQIGNMNDLYAVGSAAGQIYYLGGLA